MHPAVIAITRVLFVVTIGANLIISAHGQNNPAAKPADSGSNKARNSGKPASDSNTPVESPGTKPVNSSNNPRTYSQAAQAASEAYVLSANDLVLIKVYQEEDLTTEIRIAKDGSINFPLLETVKVGGKTVSEASAHLRDLLGKDYLVNPQVTISILEYAKRRFTVLGQVNKPGSYDIPSEETVHLHQAIAMAGGFTRIANPSKITVTRSAGNQKKSFVVDGKKPKETVEIFPDDILTVAESVF